MPSNTSKAQQMGEARDRDAMKVLIRALREHSVGDQQAIRNFFSNDRHLQRFSSKMDVDLMQCPISERLILEGFIQCKSVPNTDLPVRCDGRRTSIRRASSGSAGTRTCSTRCAIRESVAISGQLIDHDDK